MGQEVVGEERDMRLGAPPQRRKTWWDARREERAVRLAKRLAVFGGVVLLVVAGWALYRLQQDPSLRLATTCAQSPFGLGTITTAGGPAAVDDEHAAMQPYRRVPALTDRELGALRTQGSSANDREMSAAAFLAMRAAPTQRTEHYARLEGLCATRMSEVGLEPAPKEWFRP